MHSPLAVLTAPAIEQLHAQTGMVSVLVIAGYDGTVCLVLATGGMAAMPAPAAVAPARSRATGMLLLAHRETWRESVLAGCEPHERDELHKRLADVRRAGYASDPDAGTGGWREVAAPVFGPTGEVLAAVAVALAPSDPAEPTPELVAHVREAGIAASRALLAGASRYPLRGDDVYRLLAGYGLAPINAYI